jgi:hypothetical protein
MRLWQQFADSVALVAGSPSSSDRKISPPVAVLKEKEGENASY